MGDATKTVLADDGWIVTDLATYRYLHDHATPRPHAILRVFLIDVRERRVLAFWALYAAGIGMGIILVGLPGYIELALGFVGIACGLGGFLIYFRQFLTFALALRNGPLKMGIVSSLSDHPMGRKLAIAQASLWNGESIPVWLWRSPASELIEAFGSIEVLFLQSKGSGSVWGVRQAPPSIRDMAR